MKTKRLNIISHARLWTIKKHPNILTVPVFIGIGTSSLHQTFWRKLTICILIYSYWWQNQATVRRLHPRLVERIDVISFLIFQTGDKPWELDKVALGAWNRGEEYAQDMIVVIIDSLTNSRLFRRLPFNFPATNFCRALRPGWPVGSIGI